MLLADVKGEIKKLSDLVDVYKLDSADAMHLMSAESADLKYLLTNDEDFTKKSRRVPWLFTKVLKPEELLSMIK